MQVLNTKVDVLSKKQVEEKILKAYQAQQNLFIVTANAEMYYAASLDLPLQKVLNTADLHVVDSVGMRWAVQRQGDKVELYPGIELAEWILKQNWPVFVLGTKPEILEKLNCPNIIGRQHGFFKVEEEVQIVQQIKASGARVLFVALGVGKQEVWIAKYKDQFKGVIFIGIGGAVDVWAGVKKRAPLFWRKLKLEWLYRLLCEPWRIKRQVNLLKFWWAVIRTTR